MEEIMITSRQQMLSPDQLAYELGLIPTSKKIENRKIANYVIMGVLATITVGVLSYVIYQYHQESKRKKQD